VEEGEITAMSEFKRLDWSKTAKGDRHDRAGGTLGGQDCPGPFKGCPLPEGKAFHYSEW
jgi:hypothetical protein